MFLGGIICELLLFLSFSIIVFQVVESLIKKMKLTRFTNKIVKSLSGGTKRKLSTAVALLGKPDVIFMVIDEDGGDDDDDDGNNYINPFYLIIY